MKRQMAFYSLIMAFLAMLAGCASPAGTTHVYRADGGKITSPLISADVLGRDSGSIFQTDKKSMAAGNDVFSIYLTDSYFRYLSDWGGINEVVIVVEFTEVVNGDDDDRVVKVLGPYQNVADATRSPFMNKLIYGPKRMESDVLSMRLRIYEYDNEENEKNSALLNLIATSGGGAWPWKPSYQGTS